MTRYSPAEGSSHACVVSVLIPVYNASREPFERCLASVLRQAHPALDVVVVDDGSGEEVGWLDAPELGDPRVRLIRQGNGGVSAARNTGLRVARGDYVCFVDADDYLTDSFLPSALELALRTRADVVFGSVQVLHRDGTVLWRAGEAPLSNPELHGSADLDVVRAEVLASSPGARDSTRLTCVTNVHAALYSMALVRDISFREGVTQAEDRLFNVDVLGNAAKAAFCSDIWYVYDQSTPQGATRKITWATATSISATISAFAAAGDFATAGGSDRSSVPTVVREAAATGVLNYLKMLVGVLAVVRRGAPARALVNGVLQQPAVHEALAHVPPAGLQDGVFLRLARSGRVRALIAAGAIWVRISGSAPKVAHADEVIR